MKIYTGTGDGGKTSLFSGERIGKGDLRVESYGCVDELCSFIGVIGSQLPEFPQRGDLEKELQQIQGDLFMVGGLLATTPGSGDDKLLRPLEGGRVGWLESRIDAMQAELEELHSFILPGGHPGAAWSHVTRTVCRRAERSVALLHQHEECLQGELVMAYINRLSDYFFVLARYINALSDTMEITWHG